MVAHVRQRNGCEDDTRITYVAMTGQPLFSCAHNERRAYDIRSKLSTSDDNEVVGSYALTRIQVSHQKDVFIGSRTGAGNDGPVSGIVWWAEWIGHWK